MAELTKRDHLEAAHDHLLLASKAVDDAIEEAGLAKLPKKVIDALWMLAGSVEGTAMVLEARLNR